MELLDTLLLQPLVAIYASLFSTLKKGLGDVGAALIVFSLVLNVLMLPVYVQIERAAKATSWHRVAMNEEIARIRQYFSGRERYFYERTIHREFGWRPIYVLFQNLDLWVQVVVFVSVYSFLSHLPALNGASFLGIKDLGKPDALLFGVNVLPLVMTTANIISAKAFTDDKKKQKTLFAMAALFLVLLYNSPAGLVLYWTTNNVFSLVKNVVVAGFGKALGVKLPKLPTDRLAQVLRRE